MINYYITHITPNIDDGGMARNEAFKDYFLKKNNIKTINIYSSNIFIRVIKFFRILLLFLFKRDKALFIHQGTILYLFPIKIFGINFFFRSIMKLLLRVSKNNKLIIEINDLPYEQSIDLELTVNPFFLKFEENIFSLSYVHFIFASHEMELYVRNKYKIEKTSTIINGGKIIINSSSEDKFDFEINSKITFVYAGTLNKGRQIEKLISLFIGKDNVQLVLLGSGGQWIKEEAEIFGGNIYYLGSFIESDAHKIVSRCDIGIIPYDANRFYYNLCYPTKASFYITAGITFLSTPTKELINCFKNYDFVLFKELEEWDTLLKNIKFNEIKYLNSKVNLIKNRFTWDYLISKKISV